MKIIQSTRNIGISAHIDSGKTTLTERILYYAGKIHKIEEVRGDGKGATMDHMELEREKGITITSAATTVYWENAEKADQNYKINIIDTPGHVDFTVEVERSLRVLDGAILVLCGVAGVQSQSITVDRQMKRYHVPRLAFINKLDRVGANPKKVIQDLREKLQHNAVAIQIPIGLEDKLVGVVDLTTMQAIYYEGEKGEDVKITTIPADYLSRATEAREEMLEAISMFDEQMMQDLLDGKEIEVQAINQAILNGVNSLALTPVLMGSAFKNKGVQTLLDAICRYLPSPLTARPAKANSLDQPGEMQILKPDPADPLVCLAFKIADESFGQLTYTRIYSGTLEKGATIYNMRTQEKVRAGRLVRMHADHRENIDKAEAGDIVALVGVDCASGDTFCGRNIQVSLENIYVAEPVISLAIKSEDSAAADRLSKALSRFLREDPTFHVSSDIESGETIISGMGELHLEIYLERIRREYNVESLEVGKPQVNYRETITSNSEFDHTHKKQTGGAGQFAVVQGNIEPINYENKESESFVFENSVKGGNIPSEYIGACNKGFEDVMDKGPLAAYPMVGIKVSLKDGRYHDVDSSDMAFRICSRAAMRQAIQKAQPRLLEPMMRVEVETPSEYQGTVMGDLSSRRGMISGSETRDNQVVISSLVPLSEMFGYATTLRSATAGKATYTMEFEQYAACPKSIQESIIEARREQLEEAS